MILGVEVREHSRLFQLRKGCTVLPEGIGRSRVGASRSPNPARNSNFGGLWMGAS
jgi:hypothetical protein